jgi:glutamyl-tRNA synthetase
MEVITRFAPSPTGFMHIGGIRTALFAYLWARKNNGTFILRIEDTDKEREVEGSIEHIQEALSWLGIEWDYGPDKPGPFGSCIQSERLDSYKKFAQKLMDKGLAYPDPHTPEQIETYKKKADAEKRPFLVREYRPETFEKKWDGTKPLRFKVPTVKRWKWNDAVRGELEAGEEAVDDFIILKSDGYPTYNFAHIIDDHLMRVTHILRGDEFISSTPRFLSLYEGLGFEPPVLCTLPPILRDDRIKKLGKRDGAKDVLEYRTEGFLPEALFNCLAFLGWHPSDDREVMTAPEIMQEFTLERIQKAGAVFSEEKLAWFNHHYILKLSDEAFIDHAGTFLPEWLHSHSPMLKRLVPVVREKISIFSEIPALFADQGELAFVRTLSGYPKESLLWKKAPDAAKSKTHLVEAKKLISDISEDSFNSENIKTAVWPYAEANGRGDVLWPLRMALTGQEKSPDPFMSAHILGREESVRRIEIALDKLV